MRSQLLSLLRSPIRSSWRSWTVALLSTVFVTAAQSADLKESLVFHASFDRSVDADIAKGDAKVYTADSLERKEVRAGLHVGDAVQWQRKGGVKGGALRFTRKTKELVFFKGGKNVPYDKSSFSGTVSLWMKLSPQDDLPKGFVDPLQITDKKWNDASFFIDFDQAKERDFRLGAFADYKFWNPQDRKIDQIPPQDRPMVFVKKAPFDRSKWTHVAFSWSQFNTDKPAEAILYLDSKPQGSVKGKQRFSWDAEKVVIMLGINYVGLLDELMVFKRALTAAEVKQLSQRR